MENPRFLHGGSLEIMLTVPLKVDILSMPEFFYLPQYKNQHDMTCLLIKTCYVIYGSVMTVELVALGGFRELLNCWY